MTLIDSMNELARSSIDSDETLDLCDYGTVQGGSKAKQELKRAFWYQLTKSSTSAHKAYDYNIVVLTDKLVKFIPVKIGKLGSSWKQERAGQVEVYPRSGVNINAGEITTGKGFGHQKSCIVTFSLPNGAEKTVELYNSPGKWQELSMSTA